MKKYVLLTLIVLSLALIFVACNETPEGDPETTTAAQATTEAVTEAATETTAQPTTEAVTEEPTEAPTEAPTEEPTETEPETTTQAATTEPAPEVQPTAYFDAETLAALTATNATSAYVDGYAHFLTGTTSTSTNPSITLSAGEGEFTDVIAIKYRTNCGHYGSNYWGTFMVNGTEEFQGNRANSDNWFYYFTDGTWDVLILDLRKNTAGSSGTPDTDVVDGAAITSLVYNFFDYEGNGGQLATADEDAEFFDIEYIAFFNTKEEAEDYCY